MVPVIRNVETMNYADIERTISELGEKVRWKGVCDAGQVREESLGRLGQWAVLRELGPPFVVKRGRGPENGSHKQEPKYSSGGACGSPVSEDFISSG